MGRGVGLCDGLLFGLVFELLPFGGERNVALAVD